MIVTIAADINTNRCGWTDAISLRYRCVVWYVASPFEELTLQSGETLHFRNLALIGLISRQELCGDDETWLRQLGRFFTNGRVRRGGICLIRELVQDQTPWCQLLLFVNKRAHEGKRI